MESFKNFFKKSEKPEPTPDEKKPIEQIVLELLYPFETHYVETEDGYVLKIFRINGRKGQNLGEKESLDNEKINEKTINPKQPILFQHGLLDSSDGWLCNEEALSLPLLFANLGYDVWLSNSRGNKYSKSHTKHNPDNDFEFWQFSFEEMGEHDLPAVINYVLKTNTFNHKKLHYVGHSQGTCMMFAVITNPKYVEFFRSKIEVFVALAPVARVSNMKSSFLNFFDFINADKFFKHEVFPADEGTGRDFRIWFDKAFPKISNMVLDLISDYDSFSVNNQKRIPVFLSHYPSGASVKSIRHFTQNKGNKVFAAYDYQKEANMKLYGSTKPKEFNLREVKGFKIALFSGEADKLASSEDVKWLINELEFGKNVIYKKEYEKMGHISFLVGLNNNGWLTDVMEVIIENTTTPEEVKNIKDKKSEEYFLVD